MGATAAALRSAGAAADPTLVQGRRREVAVAPARVHHGPSRQAQAAAACPAEAQTLHCLAHLDEAVLAVAVRASLDWVPAALTVLGVAVQTDQGGMAHRLVAEGGRNQAEAVPKPSAQQAGSLQLMGRRAR